MAKPKKQHEVQDEYVYPQLDITDSIPEKNEVSFDVPEIKESSEPEFSESVREEIVEENLVAGDDKEISPEVQQNVEQVATEEIPAGWLHIDKAPLVGVRVHLMDPDGNAVLAFWKTTRQFVSGHWKTAGKWVDAVTGEVIKFDPIFWREGQ